MILEINFDKGEGLNLYVDGQSEHLYFDYITRVEAIRKANKRFDNDLMQAASLYPNEKKGAFFWCYTAEFLRGENVTDLVKLYFLLELVKKATEKNQAEKIILSYEIPKDAIAELKSLGLKIVKTFDFYSGILRENVKVVYHGIKLLKLNVASFLNNKNSLFEGNLMDVNERHDHFSKILKNDEFYKSFRVYSGEESKITSFSQVDVVVFRNENTFLDGFFQFYNALKLSIFIEQNKLKLPQVYRGYFRFRDFIKLWSLLLYESGVKKYFKKNQIRNLVHSSTITKPEYRILWSKAHDYKVKVILVASRTLKLMSSSERLIDADIKAYSNAYLPDDFIVLDYLSKEVFKAFHFYDRVKVGGRILPVSENRVNALIKERVVYIALTHIKECSAFLLNELKSVDFKSLGIHRIFFRCHPLAIFTDSEIKDYFPDFEVINHTGLSIHQCNYEDILMIAGPTTGAIELLKEEVTLFWLPYIWKDGILFDDIMNQVGHKVTSMNDLITKLNHLNNNALNHKKIENSQFKSSNMISSLIQSCI